MEQDPFTFYKLIVLYMLERCDFPITKAQIADFILEKEYTDFLNLQQVFSQLIEAELITAKTVRNRTHLTITEEGKKTLAFFANRLSNVTKNNIDDFFRENALEMRNEVSVLSDYYKSTSGEYEAHLSAVEKEIHLIDVTLSVPDEKTAAAICDNWQKKNQTVYQYLIEQLF
ncbi:MAG: DUF4364 family protein [Blautia sp.]|nr:DUF4364 family protein [Lachnoclostridium sp.]MCM1211976.1 DUF4364 family protein [Blautia sp.]